jgi:hypothetical protein
LDNFSNQSTWISPRVVLRFYLVGYQIFRQQKNKYNLLATNGFLAKLVDNSLIATETIMKE